MDLLLALALPCLLLLVLSLRFLQKQATHNCKSNLPPGPQTLPFIGSLHHLVTATLPHHALRDLAQLHGPVMLLRAGQMDLVVLTSREAAKEVMQTQDSNIANRPALYAANCIFYGTTDIIFSNGPYWRQMRRICVSELFSPKQVKSLSSKWKEEINSLLKSFSLVSGKSPVNLSTWTYELSNNIVIRAAFGGNFKMRQVYLEALQEEVELLSGFNLSDLFPSLSWLDVKMRRRVARVHRKLDLVLEEFVQEHLKNSKRGEEEIEYDFVDALIDIKERGDLELPITMDNIKAIILDIFNGGTETTATTITWAMAELIKHPDVMAKAQTEIRQLASKSSDENTNTNSLSYLQLVIKETLRMHPPAPLLIPRQCKESCEILGYTIPTGARMVINAWALGRNPEYWNDPDEFKPERFETSSTGIDFKGKNFEFVPFGAGRRICPGLKFGVTMVEDALTNLLLHFDWQLPDGMKAEDVDMTENFGIVAAKKKPLYLVPTLRVPLPA
ncbi:desmethyl-deoxy-podophyllotoxin synthase-like [Carex rostrata]